MITPPSPPKLFLRFFRWFCDPKLKDFIEGDLLELYFERLKTSGKRKADLRFMLDVVLLFRPEIVKILNQRRPSHSYHIYNNYLKVGVRNLLRYKSFSFINVFGLAIAMSVCMLVILMLADQSTYDQFHTRKDRIYRILSERPYSSMPFASTPPSLLETLNTEYSIIEKATHLVISVGGDARSELSFAEMRGFFADENFLQVFDFELEEGNKTTALRDPNSLVITREVADKLFGEKDALGQTVQFTDRGIHYLKGGKDSPPVDWGTFIITGVISAKKMKSHLSFEVLMSSATIRILENENKLSKNLEGWDKAFTYVLLREGKTESDLNNALNDLFVRKFAHHEFLKGHSLKGQPLVDITPGIMVNQPPSFQLPIQAYYFLGAIAIAIMLSACLNYTNLSTARALTRAKEIGVRKVTGAHRRDLVYQFLIESVLTSFLALFVAILLLIFLKPAFTGLWLNRYLQFDLETHPSVYLIFATLAVVLGILAGFYPALHLSAFQPVKAIKNPERIASGRLGMRKILSTAQFIISLFFVITSILIYTQFKYFMNFEYGFNPKDIVNIELQGNDFKRVSDAFSSVPGVSIISGSEYMPATGRTSGMDLTKPNTDESINFRMLSANEKFIENMGLTFVAGTNLPETTDSAGAHVVLNETAVTVLGFETPDEAVGQTLLQKWNNEHLQIVGVVKDFWLKLPIGGDNIEPAFLRTVPKRFNFVNVKVNPNDASETISVLNDRWKRIDPIHPFKYQFYEDELASTHAGIFDMVSVVGFLAIIAITIACLGMLGMATYTAERKRKEVGIRKVLGAEVASIALMLSRDFIKVLAFAIGIGAPLTWFINNLWLQTFANRAEFGVQSVFLGALLLLMLGLITIGSQTIRVSKSNPVDSLKTE